jgi:hypothetical protein
MSNSNRAKIVVRVHTQNSFFGGVHYVAGDR